MFIILENFCFTYSFIYSFFLKGVLIMKGAKIANRQTHENLIVLCSACDGKVKDILVITNGKGRMAKTCSCGSPHGPSVNHTDAFIARAGFGIITGASWYKAA